MKFHLDISAVYSRVQRDVALRVKEGDHFLPWASPRLTPLQKNLHGFWRGIFRCFMNRVVAIVARLSRHSTKLRDLQTEEQSKNHFEVLSHLTLNSFTRILAHSSKSCMAAMWSAVRPCSPPCCTSSLSLWRAIISKTLLKFRTVAKWIGAWFFTFKIDASAPLIAKQLFFSRELIIKWFIALTVPLESQSHLELRSQLQGATVYSWRCLTNSGLKSTISVKFKYVWVD